jgi:hypothetical protein
MTALLLTFVIVIILLKYFRVFLTDAIPTSTSISNNAKMSAESEASSKAGSSSSDTEKIPTPPIKVSMTDPVRAISREFEFDLAL